MVTGVGRGPGNSTALGVWFCLLRVGRKTSARLAQPCSSSREGLWRIGAQEKKVDVLKIGAASGAFRKEAPVGSGWNRRLGFSDLEGREANTRGRCRKCEIS